MTPASIFQSLEMSVCRDSGLYLLLRFTFRRSKGTDLKSQSGGCRCCVSALIICATLSPEQKGKHWTICILLQGFKINK